MPSLANALLSFPRVPFAQRPTPLEPLVKLSQALDGPEIWIKRDDYTGFAGGGNKARKLDFLIAHAQSSRADTLVTAGGLQSNHARQTAAAGAKSGFRVILVLQDFVSGMAPSYHTNGNLLLDRLFGAEVRVVGPAGDMIKATTETAEDVRRGGGRPYMIPVGGSSAHGVLGYVDAGVELARQATAMGLAFDRVIVASGSGGTQAGLILASLETGIAVTGYSVGFGAAGQRKKVSAIVEQAAALLGVAAGEALHRVDVDEGFVGAGYGQTTPESLDAITQLARTEGILLDPVYTGKAMAGLMHDIRTGKFNRGERIVFLHTGGSPGLFAYEEALTEYAQSLRSSSVFQA